MEPQSEHTPRIDLPGGGSVSLEEIGRVASLLLTFVEGMAKLLPADHDLQGKLEMLRRDFGPLAVHRDLPEQQAIRQCYDLLKMNSDFHLLERAGLVEIIMAFSRSLTSMFGRDSKLAQGLAQLTGELEQARGLKQTLAVRDKLLNVTGQVQKRFDNVRDEFERLHQHCITLQARADTRGEVIVDGLTRILNRRAYELKIEETLKEFHRSRTPFFLAYIDIDDFTAIRNKYGAEAANNTLSSVAGLIRDGVRGSDFVYRYSQDQFMVIFRNTTYQNVRTAAERLRDRIETVRTHLLDDIHDQRGDHVRVTVCIGLAQAKEGDTQNTLFKRAEGALRRAKLQGKNRVAIS